MSNNERGIFIQIIVGCWIFGELPRDAWRLTQQLHLGDYRVTARWQEKYRGLTVDGRSGSGYFTVPKLDELQVLLEKSTADVIRREEQSRGQQSKQGQQGLPAKPEEPKSNSEPEAPVSNSEPCPECGFSPCKKLLSCPNSDAQILVSPPKRKPEVKPDPLRDWDRDVDGIPAERIRLCVRYMLDVKKDPYCRKEISVASLSRAPKYTFLHNLVDSCPESAQIERELKAQVKMKWIWDEPCPHGCRQGRIRTLNERGIPKVQQCECYRQVPA